MTALVVAPLTAKGWLLLLDWVPGPGDDLGAKVFSGRSLPAGPLFFTLAAGLRALFGAAGAWLIVAIALVLGGWGAGVLAQRAGSVGQAVAAGAFIVNPFVHDRLYAGHVALLLAMAALPWLAHVLVEAPLTTTSAVKAALVLALAIAVDVHLAWVGGLLVLGALAAQGRWGAGWQAAARHGSVAVAVTLALTLPWLVVLAPDATPSGTVGALDAFATRADPQLGLTLGLIAQEGFWRPSPASWPGPVAVRLAALAAVLGLGALGFWSAHRRHRMGAAPDGGGVLTPALVGIAALGVVLAHGSQGPLGGTFSLAIDAVPGFSVMREAHKFTMLVTLAQAVGLALGVAALLDVLPDLARKVAVPLLCLAPLLLAPATPWGLQGSLATSRYPQSWAEVGRIIEADDLSMAVLPWVHYADPGFTGGRVVAAPARSYFGSRALVSLDPGLAGVPFRDDLEPLGATLVTGGCDAAKAALADARTGWVLLLEQPAASRPAALDCGFLSVALSRPDLVLYRVVG